MNDHLDTAKTVFTGVGGFALTLANIDLGFKILIGAATLYFVLFKIVKAHREK